MMTTFFAYPRSSRSLKIMRLAAAGFSFCAVISWSMAADADMAKTPNPLVSVKEGVTTTPPSSGMLAIVNGHAITQKEFDSVSIFPLAGIKDDAMRYQVKNKILRDLIDEYLVEQSIAETKLDQDPVFKPLLERERRTGTLNLYQIYIASISPVTLTKADIDSFIRSHQEYFVGRRTFHYIQFTLPPQSSKGSSGYTLQTVRDFTVKFNQNQFMSWLIDQGIDFQRINLWQGSEQVPPNLLPELSKLKSGSVFVEGIAAPSTGSSSSPDSNTSAIRVIYMMDSFPDPINADEARNSIARNLISQANRLKISETMQDLRAKAKIEILDENLKLEIAKLNREDTTQAAERKSARRLEYMRTAWFFCLIFLVFLALWQFFKSVPIVSKNVGPLQSLQILEQTVFMRSLETLFIGSLLLYPLVRFIFERLVFYDNKVVILSGVLGISVAVAVFWAIKKITLFRELNQNRFLAVTILLLGQYLILAF